MPDHLRFIAPALPTLVRAIPDTPGTIAEPKLDGYRCIVIKDGRDVRFFSRVGRDMTPRLPVMMDAIAKLRARRLILDCELVCVSADTRIDFYGIQTAMRRAPEKLHLFAFDILHVNDTDLRRLPLRKRQQRLDTVVGRADLACLRVINRQANAEALFADCVAQQLEGIVIKRLDQPYRSGVTPGGWVKVKCPEWIERNKDRWRRFQRPGGGSQARRTSDNSRTG